MKSKVVLIALALFSAQASAEWTFVGEDNEGNTFFVDKTTIRKQGGYILMWDLTKLKSAEFIKSVGKNYKSTKSLTAYNCQERTYGAKATANFSDDMGGVVVHSTTINLNEIKFLDVMPESVAESFFKIACEGAK